MHSMQQYGLINSGGRCENGQDSSWTLPTLGSTTKQGTIITGYGGV